jgi:aspartate carbamoyltransferase catalytic subunit
MKVFMYILAPEPISTEYLINPSPQSVSVCVSPIIARQQLDRNPPIVARQWLVINAPAATNTHATIELLDAFSMRSVYQGK